MRIAIVNETRCKTGGVESYLEQIIPALAVRGNEVACLFNSDAGDVEGAIRIPDEVPTWLADGTRRAGALAALRAWGPDVVYLHSPVDVELRNCLLKTAPGVFFAHNYYGTCISGMKRHAFPQVRPCDKVFSPACLAHYFPRRCGGLNPVTMLRRYRDENAWLMGLRDFTAIVVASEHMAVEYRRHEFGDRVQVVGLPVRDDLGARTRYLPLDEHQPCRLLFVGRMESYKGGMTLLDALPMMKHKLRQSIQIMFAGDGRERNLWEEHAKTMVRNNPGIEAKFAGWLSGSALKAAIEASHLLVFPSLWPEPFGLVGLEAGAYGVPTAAFKVGGVGDWLKDGVNGHLAPGDPPTAPGLAEAVYRCLSDEAHYADLCAGARAALDQFTEERHISRLEAVLDKVACST